MSTRKRIASVIVAALLPALVSAGPAPQEDRESRESKTRRVPQFENEHVKAWKSIILPNQPLSMHRHDHPRAIIALKGGTLKVVTKSGESHEMTWETGEAYWLTADPPGELHGDVNEGSEPVEVIVIELKNVP